MQWPRNNILTRKGPSRRTSPGDHFGYIDFVWDSSMNLKNYSVLIENTDTSSYEKWINVGPLDKRVILPGIQWVDGSKVLVVHNTSEKHRYVGRLTRGATYIVKLDGTLEAKGNLFYLA